MLVCRKLEGTTLFVCIRYSTIDADGRLLHRNNKDVISVPWEGSDYFRNGMLRGIVACTGFNIFFYQSNYLVFRISDR